MLSVEYINPFVAATLQALQVMAHSRPVRESPFVKNDSVTQGDISGVMQFSGDAVGSVAVTFSFRLAAKIYSRMVGEEAAGEDEEVRDAVGEIANMVAGGAKAAFSEKGLFIRVAVPSVFAGPKHMIPHSGAGPYLVVPFRLDDETFWLELSFTQAKKAA
jgi:chemotaxis protein CheX